MPRPPCRGAIVLLALAASAPAPAGAQALELPAIGARAAGRAGAAVVSADDHSALFYNPAGLARRADLRLQLGLALSDTSASFRSHERFADGEPPPAEDRAGALTVPWLGVQLGLGERLVVGAAFLAPGAYESATAEPPDYDQPIDPDERAQYHHRYAGTALGWRRRGAAVGAAVRALPWLALGGALHAHRVDLRDRRTIWSGLPGEDRGDPDYDMALAVTARDNFVPGVVLGVLAAPEDAPVELAAALTLSAPAELEGTALLRPSRGSVRMVSPPVRYATVVPETGARGRGRVPMPQGARAGVRFLGPRFAVEFDGGITQTGRRSAFLVDDGLLIRRQTGATRELAQIPLLPAQSSYALRLGLELDLLPGFLAASAGYGFRRGAIPATALRPTLVATDAHLFGVGLEARGRRGAIQLGVLRTAGTARTVGAGESGERILTPFLGETLVTAGGRYDGAAILVALGLELWD